MNKTLSKEELNLVIGALDSLALALTTYGHTWTDGERAIYEEATFALGVERPLETDEQ
jgi:hypothetical protein